MYNNKKFNFIIIGETMENFLPLQEEQFIDYLFERAEESYEEFLFSGGEIFIDEIIEYDFVYNYPQKEVEEIDFSEFPF